MLLASDEHSCLLLVNAEPSMNSKSLLPLEIKKMDWRLDHWMNDTLRDSFWMVLAIIGLCLFCPCLLVWLPMLAQMRRSHAKPDKRMIFGYYAGTWAGMLLFPLCLVLSLVVTNMDVSGAVFCSFFFILVYLIPILSTAGFWLRRVTKEKEASQA